MRALVSSMKKLPRPVQSDVGSSSSSSSSSEESEVEGPGRTPINLLNHPIRQQQMVSSVLQRTPDSSLNPVQDHDRDEAPESKGGHEQPLISNSSAGSGRTAPSPSPSPTHALSLEAAAKALHLSPEILRQMTTPPKT